MSWWKKEEHIHFNRDESGRVTSVIRDGEKHPVGEKTSSQLEHEYREKHPSQWQSFKSSMNERATDRMILRAKEKEASKRGYEKGRVQRAESMGFEHGRGPRPVQQPRKRIVYVHPRKSRHKHRRYTQQGPRVEYEFDMMLGRHVPVQRQTYRNVTSVFDPWTGRYIKRR